MKNKLIGDDLVLAVFTCVCVWLVVISKPCEVVEHVAVAAGYEARPLKVIHMFEHQVLPQHIFVRLLQNVLDVALVRVIHRAEQVVIARSPFHLLRWGPVVGVQHRVNIVTVESLLNW